MLRFTVLLAATLAAGPVFAAPVTLVVLNRSTMLTVHGINTFPIDDDGDAVEDNLGGFFEDVGPGGSARAELIGECGRTLVLVNLGGDDEVRTELNTCHQRTVVVSDP
jgi:hypothetical protein